MCVSSTPITLKKNVTETMSEQEQFLCALSIFSFLAPTRSGSSLPNSAAQREEAQQPPQQQPPPQPPESRCKQQRCQQSCQPGPDLSQPSGPSSARSNR